MATVQKTIDVNAPVSDVYNQWTQFESFPQFMNGVKEVHQLDEKRLHWHAEVGGKDKEWDAEIYEQTPDQVICWRSVTGLQNDGAVRFEPLGPDQTRISLTVDYDPEGMVEKVGDKLGFTGRQVEEDLERFKHFMEERQQPTGAYRGEIHGGSASGGGDMEPGTGGTPSY